ncbi:uncharacterized protein LOC126605146 [Malus sylvestris]|uniref:uncharacterized protein LOC126605146 n=1 Tax=Malus sylvestris TaxID=3752 RepID=UPI0021AC4C1A|nr:uncharacterized protein LOC126605146 [Malus sylvestris]
MLESAICLYFSQCSYVHISIMDKNGKEEISLPMPILQRLDRLDRLLQFLEHKHCLSAKHSSCPTSLEPEDDQCKTLSSAIEEAHHKGTLMERVAMLEKRVLQISHEMDVENASSSSCFTIEASEEIGQGSSEAYVRKPNCCKKGRRKKNVASIIQMREWFRWRRMGC